MNPYLVLGVAEDADDATLRRAYLEAVRIWSPEHHRERFQAITSAFEKLKDPAARTQYQLFDRTPPADSPLDLLCRWANLPGRIQPLSFEALKTHLRACSKK